MKRIVLGFMIGSIFLCGCGTDKATLIGENEKENKQYEAEESDNPVQLEIYSGENELLNVITQEEILYQYNQCLSDDNPVSVEQQNELEKNVEGLDVEYTVISYKHPAALINDQELEKNTTITIYKDSNTIKMEVSQESIKNIRVSREFLTFYYEVSDENMEFYRSLIEG